MSKKISVIFGMIMCCLSISCSSRLKISGIYGSNFAVNGFLGTRINLNKDSTFGFRMRGDMMFDTSNGHYEMNGRYIFLVHQPFQPDTSEYEKYGKDAVLLSYALSTNKHLKSAEKYMIGHRKLFVCDSNGHVVKKQFGYSKRKQYLLFGNHWYKRRYFLKRLD